MRYPMRNSTLLNSMAARPASTNICEDAFKAFPKHTLPLAVLLGAVGLATPAYAQDPSGANGEPEPSEATGADAQDDPTPIVVTAQRRSRLAGRADQRHRAQRRDALETGVSGHRTAEQSSPGLNYTRNRYFSQPYIRGIGSSSTRSATSLASRPVDGIYVRRPAGFHEFPQCRSGRGLKGPQPGRNATGGAINVIVLLPSYEPELFGASYARSMR